MLDAGARPHRFPDRLAAPAILALALVLRVREALRAPLWFDELYTREAATRPWPEMLRIMRADVHPPLQFVVSRVWSVFGDSDLAVRSASLLFALAALVLGYVLARELFGRPSALLATLLLALHPWHVYVSQEARSYPLLWASLTLAWLSAWRWCERGRRTDAALFVFAAALALWTHYLAAVLLVLPAAWGVARLAREPRRLATWVLLHAAVLVLFAPLLPLMWSQFHRIGAEHWLPAPHLAELADTARRIVFSRSLLVAPALLLALWPLSDPRARRATAFLLTVGPLALLVCWLLGTLGIRVFWYKYMMFAAAPVFTLVAAGVMRLPGRAARLVVAALLVAVAVWGIAVKPPYAEAGDFGAMRASLAGKVHAGDEMFHADSHTYFFGRHYFPALRHRLLAARALTPYYDGLAAIPDSAFGDTTEWRLAAASGRHWWALTSGNGHPRTPAFDARADALAGGPALRFGDARLWEGGRGR